jgi:DNA-binding MurR/RpiR family transcriptional regulator
MEEIGLSAAEVARRLGVTTSTIIRAAEKVNCQGMKE